MFNAYGEPIIIEINPRQSGSIAVVLASGYKLMDALIDLAINNETKLNTKISKKETKIIPYKNLLYYEKLNVFCLKTYHKLVKIVLTKNLI